MKYLLLLILIPNICFSKHIYPEKYYQEKWCFENNGKMEVVLKDGTRCDCVTETHAIEFDFGNKWAESGFQSLNYALQTGKKAGIVLIIEKKTDYKFWMRLTTLINYYKLPIDTWIMAL